MAWYLLTFLTMCADLWICITWAVHGRVVILWRNILICYHMKADICSYCSWQGVLIMNSHIFLTFRLICFETKRVLQKCYVFLKHLVSYMLFVCYTASVKWLATRFAKAGIRSIAAARTCKILHEVQTGSGDNSGSSPTHAGEYLPGDDAAGAWSWLLPVTWCQDLRFAISIHAIRCGSSTEPLFRVQ
jgi:hypothetical protein